MFAFSSLTLTGWAGFIAMAGAVSCAPIAKADTPIASPHVVVEALLAGIASPRPDADTLVSLFADDAVVSFGEFDNPGNGKSAVTQKLRELFAHGQRYRISVHSAYESGNVVVNDREDTPLLPTGEQAPFRVVGVFVVVDGKIRAWNDHERRPVRPVKP